METIYLPVLTGDATLNEAADRMAQSGVRAIILRTDDAYRLYMNRVVRDAIAAGSRICSELPDQEGQEVIELNPTVKASFALSAQSLNDTLEAQLDGVSALLGILYPPADTTLQATGLLVTRNETQRNTLLHAGQVCVCTGPMRHKAPPPDKGNGDPCDMCHGTYRCF